MDFDKWYPQGLYLVSEIQAVTEYQSQEDQSRNRPVRPRLDEVTGWPLFPGTFPDPAVKKDHEKAVTVKSACAQQPVSPKAVAGLPFRPVMLEGMTVQPRAEASGQVKWITWTIRATGMKSPGGASAEGTAAGMPRSGRPRPTRRRGLQCDPF